MQAKDIPDETVIELVRACVDARCDGDETWGWHGGRPGYSEGDPTPPKGHWANRFDIRKALGDPPEKVVLAKLRSLVKRGLITGCTNRGAPTVLTHLLSTGCSPTAVKSPASAKGAASVADGGGEND